MKTLSGKKLLQDLGLKAGELVRVGDTVYRYDPEVYGTGTKWERLTPITLNKLRGKLVPQRE